MIHVKSYSYDDIFLIPKYSELNSRTEADTSINFLGHSFKLPVFPSNMESVINESICRQLALNGYFYVMHRFNVKVYDFVKSMQDTLVSISIGVNSENDYFKDFKRVIDDGLRVDFVTVDVAHGHHIKMKEMLKWLKSNLKESTKIIAGNTATLQACYSLEQWGADCVKVGIGGGSICTTRLQTGFTFPMFSCLEDCSKHLKSPIISDGGVKHIGDVAKALVAGTDMVMSGALFAGCIDSAGKVVNGRKQYYGSTSFQAKKENNHIEGRLVDMPLGVTILERMKEIQMALQSSISYAGGNDLSCFSGVSYGVYHTAH